MQDALYWTASTIAQTLAGAMGILAAFVLYRLQVARRELETTGRAIRDAVLRQEETRVPGDYAGAMHSVVPGAPGLRKVFDDLLVTEDWQEFETKARDHHNQHCKDNLRAHFKWYNEAAPKFYTANARRRGVLRWLWIALGSTAMCVGAALTTLPFARLARSWQCWPWAVMFVTIAGALWCLVAYLKLVAKALK